MVKKAGFNQAAKYKSYLSVCLGDFGNLFLKMEMTVMFTCIVLL